MDLYTAALSSAAVKMDVNAAGLFQDWLAGAGSCRVIDTDDNGERASAGFVLQENSPCVASVSASCRHRAKTLMDFMWGLGAVEVIVKKVVRWLDEVEARCQMG